MKNQARDYRISNLRIICIILVVFAHSIILYKDGWGLYSTNKGSLIFNYLCQGIYLFHMPLFFAISGFLAKNSYSRVTNLCSFIAKKAKRLLIPYVIFGLFYLLPIRYAAQYDGYTEHSLPYNIFVNVLLGKDNGHIWFLASLFVIFVLHILIVKYVKNKYIATFLVLALSAIGIFIPTLIGKALKNLVWFHSGYLINGKEIKKKNSLVIALISVILGVLYFMLPESIAYYSWIRLCISYCVSVTVIVSLFNLVPQKYSGAMSGIEKNSMGIYLFHSPLIYFMFSYFSDIDPTIMFLINFLVLGTVAYLLTEGTRRVGAGKVMGE